MRISAQLQSREEKRREGKGTGEKMRKEYRREDEGREGKKDS